MKYKILDFCKKDKVFRRECSKTFFGIQGKEFLISYIFIVLSSSKQVFSLTNGAVYVFLWYTLSVLISLYAYINQSEYNNAIKKAKHFSRRHSIHSVEIRKKISVEIGGWNLISAQFISAIVLVFVLAIFSLISQTNSFSNYINKHKDFCVGIFADTYVATFFTIYYKGVVCDLKLVSGWKKKADYFLHTFDGNKIKNVLIHVLSLIIIVYALTYYFHNEFSGLFNPTIRRAMGFIYILYMIDIRNILKRLIRKIKKEH